jgi:glycosyltransferase involved in cell wall biosynthesis
MSADPTMTGVSPPLLPVVTVVIPARNEENFIVSAVASVAAQNYPLDSLECIVVDNGSTDNTASVAARFVYERSDLDIKVESEPIPGVGRAKNRGAAVARGEILMFMDADSRMDSGLTKDVAAAWKSGNPAGSIRIVADSRHPLDQGFFALMEVGKVLFGIRSQMMYCDNALFRNVGGFDAALHLAEDLEFLKRVQARVRETQTGRVCHVRTSAIRTSPRRLRTLPFHLGMIQMFARWTLAFLGIGRERRY